MTRNNILTFEQLPDVNSTEWLSLNDFEGEIWKYVDGFDESYAVSNYGRVKSLQRTIMRNTGTPQTIREKILLQTKNTTGYYCVSLIAPDIKRKTQKVHILVANAFVENVNSYKCINHKDENKCNNHFLNLEFCTYKYNLEYRNGTQVRARTRKERHPARKVFMCSRSGRIVREFESTQSAADFVGCTAGRIWECCSGKRKSAKGYLWKWKELRLLKSCVRTTMRRSAH